MGRTTRPAALPLAAVALVLVIAACGGHQGTGTSSDAAPSGPPRPPSASLTFSGDPGLAGEIRDVVVTCSFPDVTGLRISVFAQAADASLSYRMTVGPDEVIVHADAGAGPTFRERNFRGAGVTGFDARRSAHLDAELSDAEPSPGVGPGSIGRVTAVKGSIACGDQEPGSSTLTITGSTPAGRYDGSSLDPVVVECYFADDQVTAIGVARAGTTKVLLMVSFGPDGLGVEEALGPEGQRYYSSTPPAASAGDIRLGPDGASATGDVVERNSPNPHTLHIDGDVHCGTPIRS